MKKRLLQALARLGSIDYQDAYIVEATPDEYVLPEDLVEDVASLCALAIQDQYRHQFTEEQILKLDEVTGAICKYGKPIFAGSGAMDANTLVHKDDNWISLREVAQRCLVAFGVNFEKLSPADIEKEYKIQ